MKRLSVCFVVFLGLLTEVSCLLPSSHAKIMAAAKGCATRAGYAVQEFSVEVDDSTGRQEIAVFFEGKRKRPGNHFVVYVDRSTLNCRLIAGR